MYAYSGGLDTSVAVKWIQEEWGAEVIRSRSTSARPPTTRGPSSRQARALAAGAVDAKVVDPPAEFAKDFCFPALQANALYEGVYPLSAALSRPLIAKHLVDVARKHGATAVAHGATGKGNDQVRFDLAVKGLEPALKIIAPQRERNISRDEAMDYAAKHGIAVPTTRKSPFSIDENLWGRSIEGGVLEEPGTEPPEEAFAWTKSWKDAPAEPGLIRIGFEGGYPVSVNGERLSPASSSPRSASSRACTAWAAST